MNLNISIDHIDDMRHDGKHQMVLFSELIRPNLPDYNNPFTFVRPL